MGLNPSWHLCSRQQGQARCRLLSPLICQPPLILCKDCKVISSHFLYSFLCSPVNLIGCIAICSLSYGFASFAILFHHHYSIMCRKQRILYEREVVRCLQTCNAPISCPFYPLSQDMIGKLGPLPLEVMHL